MLVLHCGKSEFHLLRELYQCNLVSFALDAHLGYVVAYPPAVLRNISWVSRSYCW